MTDNQTAFVGPLDKATARRLLAAADEIGVDPQSIATTNGGFLVPVEIVDHLDSKEKEAHEANLAAKAAAQAAADALRAAADKAEKEAAEKAAADKAAKTTTSAPRARRTTKASSAGKEKD